jgi:polyhydroxybutyrate depolymerase
MKNPALIALLLVFLHPLAAQTTIQGSFEFDGLSRNYRLYVPASYNPDNATPLLLNLHGYGSNNIEQENYGDFRPIADTAAFLIVHPNGTPDGSNQLFWNTFGTSDVDDLGFLEALIDTISDSYNIDSERVYSTGMSNGGFMSYHLACFLSHRIAAIASVTGTMTNANLDACSPQRPVPVMQIHGTADNTVPYNGNIFFVSVPNLINYWVTHNECDPAPVMTPVPDIDPNDGCTAENYLYSNGADGATVEHYKIIGGGHSWPGAPLNINVTNMDFSASEAIWRFFRKYSLNGLITDSKEIIQPAFNPTIWPNPSKGDIQLYMPWNGAKNITVVNQLGQKLFELTTSDKWVNLEINQSGVHFVIIDINGQTISKTILIQ